MIKALQCCDSLFYAVKWVIFMHTYIPSFLNLPPTPPSHPTRSSQSPELSSLCYRATSHQLSVLHMLLSQFVPPAPSPLCPHVDSLCLHLYSCPADRFFCTIFLDSIYICVNIWYLFFSFWLTSLWMTDSGFIHITTNDPIYFLFMAK